MMNIQKIIVGPISTNCYLLADPETNEAVVIDPGWDGGKIVNQALNSGWKITQVWYTHAHFDHFAGAEELVRHLGYTPSIAMHSADLGLWKAGGGSVSFGVNLNPGPVPGVDLATVHSLSLGEYYFRVVHVPGHSPGSCLFYCASENTAFSGDLIFYRSVGRTDLPGGDWALLETSIKKKVYTLPGETRIFPGHGAETTVLEEKEENPYVDA